MVNVVETPKRDRLAIYRYVVPGRTGMMKLPLVAVPDSGYRTEYP
jgi:hypothetical protein